MLKDAATRKMRLRLAEYWQGESCHALSMRGQIMQHKNYGTSKENNVAVKFIV